jgi:hypothetical protein
MKRAVLFAVLLASAMPAFAIEFSTNLSEDGLGNVKIGMPVEQIELQFHDKFGYNPYENHGCSMLTTPLLEPTGISVMIEAKHLTRINIDYVGKSALPATIKTSKGIGLGSSEEDVLKAYPNARVKVNPADPTWHTIFAETPDQAKGIVFETNGKAVKSMRAGVNPAISYPNGCL